MTKITFRADDDLAAALDAFEVSKSEVLRHALRDYLVQHPEIDLAGDDGGPPPAVEAPERPLPAQGDGAEATAEHASEQPEVTVNVHLDGVRVGRAPTARVRGATHAGADDPAGSEPAARAEPPENGPETCERCGEELGADHVYCPNCGATAAGRTFCACGDELRPDWSFCPTCGRRTAAGDVLESG